MAAAAAPTFAAMHDLDASRVSEWLGDLLGKRGVPAAKVAAVQQKVIEERISGDVLAFLDERALKECLGLGYGDCVAVVQARSDLQGRTPFHEQVLAHTLLAPVDGPYKQRALNQLRAAGLFSLEQLALMSHEQFSQLVVCLFSKTQQLDLVSYVLQDLRSSNPIIRPFRSVPRDECPAASVARPATKGKKQRGQKRRAEVDSEGEEFTRSEHKHGRRDRDCDHDQYRPAPVEGGEVRWSLETEVMLLDQVERLVLLASAAQVADGQPLPEPCWTLNSVQIDWKALHREGGWEKRGFTKNDLYNRWTQYRKLKVFGCVRRKGEKIRLADTVPLTALRPLIWERYHKCQPAESGSAAYSDGAVEEQLAETDGSTGSNDSACGSNCGLSHRAGAFLAPLYHPAFDCSSPSGLHELLPDGAMQAVKLETSEESGGLQAGAYVTHEIVLPPIQPPSFSLR